MLGHLRGRLGFAGVVLALVVVSFLCFAAYTRGCAMMRHAPHKRVYGCLYDPPIPSAPDAIAVGCVG